MKTAPKTEVKQKRQEHKLTQNRGLMYLKKKNFLDDKGKIIKEYYQKMDPLYGIGGIERYRKIHPIF